jgi:transmembrane sensor
MTNYENVIYLLKKYTDGKASEEEVDELFFWLRKGNYDAIIHEALKKQAAGTVKDANYDPAYWESAIQRVLRSDPAKKETPVRTMIPWRRIAVAVCFLVATGIGLYYWLPARKQGETVKTSPGSRFKNDVKPGKDGAILTLADGSKIILDSTANGALGMQGTVKVTKVNGMLLYDYQTGKDDKEVAHQPMYNLLSTPKGRQFQLLLPDGSKVWLNALSSIRYPTAFVENHRTVQLTGEAYFEVAKDATKPFHVQVAARHAGKEELDVQALGTQFNINAYNDEPAILATLVEGSVKLSAGNDTKVIVPGQQGIVSSQNELIKLRMADVEQVLAWKNGYFILNGTSIQAVMRQLTRWYDVEVVYKGDFKGDDFAGEIRRTENLSQVLEMLELTDVVHFTVEGKTVTVSQ